MWFFGLQDLHQCSQFRARKRLQATFLNIALFPQPPPPIPSLLSPSLSISLHLSVPLSISATASLSRVFVRAVCPVCRLPVRLSLARRLLSVVLRAVVRMCIQGPLESDELRAAKNKLLQVLASDWWALGQCDACKQAG